MDNMYQIFDKPSNKWKLIKRYKAKDSVGIQGNILEV